MNLITMQPYTPHGDSNPLLRKIRHTREGCNLIPLTGTVTRTASRSLATYPMQPYTPHGDSNPSAAASAHKQSPMQPYTPHGDSNHQASKSACTSSMQPYTPHGDSNGNARSKRLANSMQPYTPHGDSNASSRVMVSPPSNDATLFLLRLADFCRAPVWCLQKVGALRQPWHRCFVRWTRSPRLPLTGTVTTQRFRCV